MEEYQDKKKIEIIIVEKKAHKTFHEKKGKKKWKWKKNNNNNKKFKSNMFNADQNSRKYNFFNEL